jgi:hypothetical protein
MATLGFAMGWMHRVARPNWAYTPIMVSAANRKLPGA